MKRNTRTDSGFTIIELLVAIAIAALVMAGLWRTFSFQQQSYNLQRQVVAMEQNLRAGMQFMESEIRMAGFDPSDAANAGIVNPGTDTIHFTTDLNFDGDVVDTDEDVTYKLYTATDGIQKLGREILTLGGTTTQAVAEYIDNLAFAYLDGNSVVMASPSSNPTAIRAVRITLRARTVSTSPIRYGELTTLIRSRNLGL
ncbi:MAG: prepilin-type N-terminal cleavage/methylation domain-containing protein [Pseudomonadota bacterium]